MNSELFEIFTMVFEEIGVVKIINCINLERLYLKKGFEVGREEDSARLQN